MSSMGSFSSGMPGPQLGWMSSNQLVPFDNPQCIAIRQAIGEQNAHSLTIERISWLYFWCGGDTLDAAHHTPNPPPNYLPSVRNRFLSRVQFLRNAWSDPHFRPFETIYSAQATLESQPNRRL